MLLSFQHETVVANVNTTSASFACASISYFYTDLYLRYRPDPLIATRNLRNPYVKPFHQLATLDLSCMSYTDSDQIPIVISFSITG